MEPNFDVISISDMEVDESQLRVSPDLLANIEQARIVQAERIYDDAKNIHDQFGNDSGREFLDNELDKISKRLTITNMEVAGGVISYEQANPILLNHTSRFAMIKEWSDQVKLIDSFPLLSDYLTSLQHGGSNGG